MIQTSLKPSITFDAMEVGRSYRITKVEGGGDLVCQCYEMGLGEGAEFRIEKKGNPCIVWAGQCKLALSYDIFKAVEISLEACNSNKHPKR